MESLHLNERERIVVHQGGYNIGHMDGLEEGEAKGRAEGRAEEKSAIARALLADGISPEKVAQYTGQTVEDVNALGSSQN